jgi:hypothetical protein
METNELRIGNWVFWNTSKKVGIFHQVILVSKDRINTIPISLGKRMDDYQFIPLSEEILSKCGFEIFFATDPQEDNPLKLYTYKSFQLVRHERDIYFIYASENYIVKVKYIHQLQNLYFALSGEELTIKL